MKTQGNNTPKVSGVYRCSVNIIPPFSSFQSQRESGLTLSISLVRHVILCLVSSRCSINIVQLIIKWSLADHILSVCVCSRWNATWPLRQRESGRIQWIRTGRACATVFKNKTPNDVPHSKDTSCRGQLIFYGQQSTTWEPPQGWHN